MRICLSGEFVASFKICKWEFFFLVIYMQTLDESSPHLQIFYFYLMRKSFKSHFLVLYREFPVKVKQPPPSPPFFSPPNPSPIYSIDIFHNSNQILISDFSNFAIYLFLLFLIYDFFCLLVLTPPPF